MKKYLLYQMLFASCMFCSCRNYEKEFKQLVRELEQKGVFLHQEPDSHVAIYEENGCVMSNDLESCKVVFSPEKVFKAYSYQLNVENTGQVNVITKIKDVCLDKNEISYKGSIILTYPLYYHIYISSKKLLDENDNIRGYNCYIPTDTLFPDLKTTTWYNEDKKKDEEWNVISSNASILSDKLNTLGLKLEPLPGKLTMYFKSTSGNKVKEVLNVMKYSCDEYGIEYNIYNFQNIDEVLNFYYYIMMDVKIKTEGDDFIKLEDISKAYSDNAVRADALFKGKTLKILCKLEQINNNDNLLMFLNYKYKMTASHSLLFGGIKIEAYSNDENFANINYPANVYMEATLYSAKRGYVFTDCKMMMVK